MTEKSNGSSMNKGQLVHIAGEAIVLTGITLYLMNRITALENKVAELEKDAQSSARHHLKAEKHHSQAMNQISLRLNEHDQGLNSAKNQWTQLNQSVNHVAQQLNNGHNPNHASFPPANPPASNQKPKHYQQHPPAMKKAPKIEEMSEEDQLLENEFGDSEGEEEEFVPPPKPAKKGRVKFKPEKKAVSGNSRNMDDVKAKAARLQAQAGDD